jgi:glycine/D-amino acid oxidase-like deaminating enzyme
LGKGKFYTFSFGIKVKKRRFESQTVKIIKNINTPLPWLIVGQGIAGTTLALTLIEKGEWVLVVDADLAGAASGIAAGVFNPVTGKRMQLTWQAATLWPILETFYTKAEALLQATFYYKLPNMRPLFTAPERAEAEKYAHSSALKAWVELKDVPSTDTNPAIKAPFGFLVVPRAGFVDVRSYTHAARAWLQNQNAFLSDEVKPNEVTASTGHMLWKGKAYKGILWADGYLGASNPLQKGLPHAPLKGEILRLKQAENCPPLTGVLNRAAYLAPRPDGTLWAGSTYEHSFANALPTEEGKISILERIARFYLADVTVLEHQAGIRPSVLDRRPIVGALPQAPGHFVFSGLGTKGVTLAPWLAQTFADHLLLATPLPLEICLRAVADPKADE